MNTSVVATAYHRDVREVQPTSALGHRLSSACEHAPFDRLAWWQALSQHCGLDGSLHAALDGERCALLALMPAGPGHLTALANWYTFRFRPIGAEHEDLLERLARDLKRAARHITLSPVPAEDGSAQALERAFRRAGWWVSSRACDTNHTLDLAGRDYQSYLATRPGPLRTTLRRKAGKVDTRILTRFDAGAWEAYEAIYAESWKGAEGSPAFLRAFAQAEGAAGRLRLGLAYDKAAPTAPPIAAQMWTIEGGTAYIHKLAHRERARALSPGSVLSAALFRHAIDVDTVRQIDFGTGNDPYKRDWMETVQPRYHLEMLLPTRLANAPRLARLLARQARARLAADRASG
ncbi:GNAT family N-acetyltransferase [Novosphingobium sp. 1949]|uniref:GNAT family N-acetyltransferase n=1 Tax=Novosphingobium organovorum TaxID=2930092 RepID=A0ABT0B9C0_9SPHN|nr:GNAT family N-acetyltransferase [Novosphingobium organovorum]MCJ2181657.1 GNAT family N-acetyltransferase [Novosphingobium organovorum]